MKSFTSLNVVTTSPEITKNHTKGQQRHKVMNGAGLKDVQEIMGHKTMSMTMRYSHLSQEHKKKAVNLLNGLTTFSTMSQTRLHQQKKS